MHGVEIFIFYANSYKREKSHTGRLNFETKTRFVED